MKFRLILLLLILGNKVSFSQAATDFNSGLLNLTKQVAAGILDTTIVKLAVWDFTDLTGATTTLGKFISEETQINFLNTGRNFEIMDRNHLAEILKEHKLNADGFIDEKTAKELGKLQAVDAIVTGTVTVLNDKIKISMKVLNTETASTIAGRSAEFAMNDDIKMLLGLTGYDNSGQTVDTDNKLVPGANEVYNDDKLVNSNCLSSKSGDYCFYNSTKYNLYINMEGDGGRASQGGSQSGIVKSGETKCFYSKYTGRYIFNIIYNPSIPNFEAWGAYKGECKGCKVYKEGAFFVEECKSKTYTIK